MVANSPTSVDLLVKHNGGSTTPKKNHRNDQNGLRAQGIDFLRVQDPVFFPQDNLAAWQNLQSLPHSLDENWAFQLCEMKRDPPGDHGNGTGKNAPPSPLFCGEWGPHLTGVVSNCWDNKFEAVDSRKSWKDSRYNLKMSWHIQKKL